MNFKYHTLSFTAAVALGLFSACEPEIDRDLPDYNQVRGEADFSVYVALGNSLTAGVADNALNREGQINSYPAIMAEKMAAVTPNFEFNLPLLPEGIADGTLLLRGIGPTGLPIIEPSSGGLSQTEIYAPVTGTFNNLAVPGAKVGHLTLPGFGSPQGNPYFARFASAPTATVVEDAIALDPTFFTLWIGNNDVLGYATQGGEGTITPVAEFQASMEAIVNQLTGSNPQIEGAIANIPNVSKIPFLNTVPWNAFNITAEQASAANAGYQAMIDPAIESAATNGVIQKVVTENAIKGTIIPGVARAIVKQNIAQSEPCNTSPDPAECAETVIESGFVNQQISDLTDRLITNYFLPAEERDAELAAAYVAIDAQVEANQETINQNVEQTIAAYKAEQLPPANQAALKAAIDSVTNAQISQLKAGKFYPEFVAGPNGFVVFSEQSPTGIKQLTEGEKITLTFLSQTEYDPASGQPVPDKFALDQFELAEISAAIDAYNTIIANIAQENTFALVNMNAFFEMVAGGYTDEGTTFSAEFVRGNAFSLDGVHLTQKGYALVAKKFIQEINSYYGSNIPEPKLANYPTIALPQAAN